MVVVTAAVGTKERFARNGRFRSHPSPFPLAEQPPPHFFGLKTRVTCAVTKATRGRMKDTCRPRSLLASVKAVCVKLLKLLFRLPLSPVSIMKIFSPLLISVFKSPHLLSPLCFYLLYSTCCDGLSRLFSVGSPEAISLSNPVAIVQPPS